MCSDYNRIKSLLETAIREMKLIISMSAPIEKPNDFGTDLNGMTIFRACSMSLQYEPAVYHGVICENQKPFRDEVFFSISIRSMERGLWNAELFVPSIRRSRCRRYFFYNQE